MRKIIGLLFFGIFLTGCYTSSLTMVGPATGVASGKLSETATSATFNHIVKKQTGKTALEHVLSEKQIKKLVQQIEKQVDVIKAFYHTDKETIFLESALYKVKSSSLFEERQIQNIIKDSHANIVTVSPEFFVIEKTGFRKDTEKLREDLSKYGLLQFVRSGRISVTKAPMGISQILNNFKNQNKKNE